MSQQEGTTNTKGKKHLNQAEREIIERLIKEKRSKGEIAKILGRDKSTIKREIRRHSVTQIKENPYASRNPKVPDYLEKKVYFSDSAQDQYERARMNGGRKSKLTACAKMLQFVEEKVLGAQKWSPDAAIGYAKAQGCYGEGFSTKTFYNWTDDGLTKVKNLDLLLKVKRKPKNHRRERKRKLGKSIDERPPCVDTRQEFGHWEGDGIVGKRQQGHLISLVERKTGMGLLFNVGDKCSDKIVQVLDSMQADYGQSFPKLFRSITFDNGSEFACSDEMEKGGRTQVYYAHPYSSFERGTNENWNGIVRRFIPKGTSFDSLTDETLHRITNYINTLPRKRFGYKSPLQIWEAESQLLISA